MARWWNDVTKEYIPRSSPRKMEARFGGSFVDGAGNAQTSGDWNFNPDVNAVAGVETKYWTGTSVVTEMTQVEKDAVDAAETTARRANNRSVATTETGEETPEGVRVRALIELLNKRDNYLTNRIIELQEDLQAIKASSGPADNIRAAVRPSYLATSTRPKPAAVTEYNDDINAGNQDT